ncbi:hypothetical protein AJ79_04810 [Helicocarpus griseus UAMH5409]|uniref:Aminoglycoside phosphotransferase domain-containing protein n=1 Tax=Helicocarpus griseus UAMH5409 TaxID=1447875 RepID=A0A2B7XSE4_9EURO|nr:hypothetical protein AJ79_04810 [Helicocarpus griseus UAMH5409]
MNNGQRFVAKFPTSVAGPLEGTNSEVATMAYRRFCTAELPGVGSYRQFNMKLHTKIPIPSVLDWSDDPSNPAGSAYIIMEHADGVSPDQAWPKMTVP